MSVTEMESQTATEKVTLHKTPTTTTTTAEVSNEARRAFGRQLLNSQRDSELERRASAVKAGKAKGRSWTEYMEESP